MPIPLPRLMFSRLAASVPTGALQLYDGLFPQLVAGTYSINVNHEVTPPSGTSPTYSTDQDFIVQAPEFYLDPGIVSSNSPPDGAVAVFDQQLPVVTLNDPSLPWEREINPGEEPVVGKESLPWMALLIFAEGEIALAPASSSPVITSTVGQLLAADPNILKPTLPSGWVTDELMNSQCQSIIFPGTSWSLLPSKSDLTYLAHCRTVNAENEDQSMMSVLLGNRLPLANTGVTPAQPVRYYAHVVSLEGFGAYLAPGQALPTKPAGGLVDVQMVSLANWTFISMPETGVGFEELIEGLIESESSTALLRLVPAISSGNSTVDDRISWGYAPLTLQSLSGEQSFAWYRGPFTPVVPQDLPPVGDPSTSARYAQTADELMIYLEDQGLFDMSYAAAWNMGRELALANSSFVTAIARYRRLARTAVLQVAERRRTPSLLSSTPTEELANGSAKRSFSRQMATGMAMTWHSALTAATQPPAQVTGRQAITRTPRIRARKTAKLSPMNLVAQPRVIDAVAQYLDDATNPIAEFLAALSMLTPLPFSSLVPDARMLPVESIRFFYVDPNWIDALLAGATSLAANTGLDIALAQALAPKLNSRVQDAARGRFRRTFANAPQASSANPITQTGLLIRSAVISGWPTMAISGSAGGTPLNIVRDDTLAPDVRLVIFSGVPDTVMLAEPYQGLQFGVEDNGIVPRYVTSAGPIGGQIPNIPPVPPAAPGDGYKQFLALYTQGTTGVVQVTSLAAALKTATTAGSDFGAGDFALQIVRSPEMQNFKASSQSGVNL